MEVNEFNNGIWTAVQFLVISHNETELAKQLVEESGLSKDECFVCQNESDYENKEMCEFINDIF